VRKILILSVITLCFPLVAAAEDHPTTEIFGGFSILGVDAGDYEAFYGFQANVAFNFHENIGIVMDFGGQYKNLDGSNFHIYQYLFGPRFSMRADTATVFAHTLFGGVAAGGDNSSEGGFAMGFGGGVDINAGDRIAVRAVQFDWTPNRIDGYWSKSEFRLGFGVVFRFGN
jgi:hypothetical protein